MTLLIILGLYYVLRLNIKSYSYTIKEIWTFLTKTRGVLLNCKCKIIFFYICEKFHDDP